MEKEPREPSVPDAARQLVLAWQELLRAVQVGCSRATADVPSPQPCCSRRAVQVGCSRATADVPSPQPSPQPSQAPPRPPSQSKSPSQPTRTTQACLTRWYDGSTTVHRNGSVARRIPAVSPPTAFLAEKIQCRFKDRGCPFRTAHVPAQKQHEKTCAYQPRDTLQSQVLLTASPFGLQAQQRRAAQINDLAEQITGDENSCTQAEIHLASYRSELAMRESGQFTELEIAEKLRADRQLRAGGTRTRAGGSRTDGRRENRTGGKKHRKVYSTDVKSRILHELDDLLHRMPTGAVALLAERHEIDPSQLCRWNKPATKEAIHKEAGMQRRDKLKTINTTQGKYPLLDKELYRLFTEKRKKGSRFDAAVQIGLSKFNMRVNFNF